MNPVTEECNICVYLCNSFNVLICAVKRVYNNKFIKNVTPGAFGLPQPLPHDTIPVKTPLTTNGPPPSPLFEMENNEYSY